MRINIASSHRFHLLDLARGLDELGHEVRFYSYVPTHRASSFGLRKKCVRPLLFSAWPLVALEKITGGAHWVLRLKCAFMDFLLAWFMPPCDVYIALGTVYEYSIRRAKIKYGAMTILEWGSKHVLKQAEALQGNPVKIKQSRYFCDRSLLGYESADFISVPSEHVVESFLAEGLSSAKLIKNRYGVDVSMFAPTNVPGSDAFDLITVGAWSYRKGSDLLVQLCRTYGYTLLHVGPIVDIEFPTDSNFKHFDAVDQRILRDYYASARVFILPSREEGLAMVQVQALACGLPIVCSAHTGGRDLKELAEDGTWIMELADNTIEAMRRSVEAALKLAAEQTGIRQYCTALQAGASWVAYAKRYEAQLNQRMLAKKEAAHANP